MSPEANRFLTMSRSFLLKAEGMRRQGWPDEAGRAAYLAALHGAQAAIFELSGKVVKTHRGVHTEFARIVRDVPGHDPEVWSFLRRGYGLKSIADYGIDPDVTVTDDEAKEAIRSATLFVDRVLEVLTRKDV